MRARLAKALLEPMAAAAGVDVVDAAVAVAVRAKSLHSLLRRLNRLQEKRRTTTPSISMQPRHLNLSPR